jgi:hypothetical protein
MKKTLRFTVLAAVLSLTFWTTTAKTAQAFIPCTFEHGRTCTGTPGWVYCDIGKECFCNGGHWDCGCFIDDANGQLIC